MVEADVAESVAKRRLGIVLFNLGGPDRLESVAPFLRNLFRDPAILRVPFFIRPFLARFIARRRRVPATEIYKLLGGKSPLLELTEAQARALELALPAHEVRCVVAMRYWHPFSTEAARLLRDWAPDEILLLPLYPQYSSTTTGSSLAAWREAAAQAGLVAPVTILCCWPDDPGIIAASAALLRTALDHAIRELGGQHPVRVLFSAHGLPERIVQQGDPYQFQITATAAALVAQLAVPGLDWRICYQSRATPQKWLDPSTEHEIAEAAREGVALVVVPVAFVSEHSETLVELDIEYRDLALRLGVPLYVRVPAQNADAGFIVALASMAERSLARGPGLCSHLGGRFCPPEHRDCPHRMVAPA